MSYLEKYHLKKVEPVKGRPKNIYADYLKTHQRVEKVGVVKPPIKRKIPAHRNYFQKEEERTPPIAHKTEKYIRIDSNQLIEDLPRNNPRDPSPKSKNSHRNHKSLNFKSGKDNSTGAKILTSIQGFFNKIMRNNQGCNCADPCPWGSKFFRWVDVPLDIIRGHYNMLLSRWQSAIKPQGSEVSNSDSRFTYESAKTIEESRKNLKQIIKDIDRTQSQHSTFQNAVFKKRQINILMCYAAEDPKIGYIQGMNIILSGILYHVKDEIKSFAIFRNIVLNIRSMYMNEFQECYSHIAKVKDYLDHELFEEINVDLNIICLPWILSLLTCIVPLDHLHLIYDGFINQKWTFIYKSCLAIFIYHKPTLMQLDDPGDIISILSPTNEAKNECDWQDILAFAASITL